MSLTDTVVLPGDSIPASDLPTSSKNPSKALTIGPGLRHIPPTTILSTTTGSLISDPRKPALWIESNGGRYIPTPGDLVIATVHHSSADSYLCTITPHTPYASLPHLAFESASRKTRPQLPAQSLVYARIATAHPHPPHQDPTLTCVSATTGKADGMGPLKGGMVYNVSLGLARRLLMGGRGRVGALEGLAERGVRFEIAVGRNGVVWVEGEDVRTTVAVGRVLAEIDRGFLGLEEQVALVERVARTLK